MQVRLVAVRVSTPVKSPDISALPFMSKLVASSSPPTVALPVEATENPPLESSAPFGQRKHAPPVPDEASTACSALDAK